MVEYHGKESPGTIVIDTPKKFLFLVQGDGKALRYGVGVGRPASPGRRQDRLREEGMAGLDAAAGNAARRPDCRGTWRAARKIRSARARCIWFVALSIHGSNEPWTIGTNVSFGCIRMRNDDVIDLYGRVGVGARVVVI